MSALLRQVCLEAQRAIKAPQGWEASMRTASRCRRCDADLQLVLQSQCGKNSGSACV